MPIRYQIDHEQRLVTAVAEGILTSPDIFTYQRDAWARPDVTGYDEVVDMSAVTQLESVVADQVQQLAALSAKMDSDQQRSKFAIVAPETLHYGLGRMYQTYRELQEESTKEVGVFLSREAAARWLGKNVHVSFAE